MAETRVTPEQQAVLDAYRSRISGAPELVKAFDHLRAFAPPSGVRAGELCRAVGIEFSTIYRLRDKLQRISSTPEGLALPFRVELTRTICKFNFLPQTLRSEAADASDSKRECFPRIAISDLAVLANSTLNGTNVGRGDERTRRQSRDCDRLLL